MSPACRVSPRRACFAFAGFEEPMSPAAPLVPWVFHSWRPGLSLCEIHKRKGRNSTVPISVDMQSEKTEETREWHRRAKLPFGEKMLLTGGARSQHRSRRTRKKNERREKSRPQRINAGRHNKRTGGGPVPRFFLRRPRALRLRLPFAARPRLRRAFFPAFRSACTFPGPISLTHRWRRGGQKGSTRPLL